LKDGIEDVFPDKIAKELYSAYKLDPKALEKHMLA
jgi:hypothetical protein